jgi:hypothetical protein
MLDLAASLVAKLSLLRSHLVTRVATASLVDQVGLGVQLELLSHSYCRLRRVLYLLLVLRLEQEL